MIFQHNDEKLLRFVIELINVDWLFNVTFNDVWVIYAMAHWIL